MPIPSLWWTIVYYKLLVVYKIKINKQTYRRKQAQYPLEKYVYSLWPMQNRCYTKQMLKNYKWTCNKCPSGKSRLQRRMYQLIPASKQMCLCFKVKCVLYLCIENMKAYAQNINSDYFWRKTFTFYLCCLKVL